ncbi:hypothetical protein J2Z69_001850 [Paenibacillus shirakamiensis]|uniref:Uncharacterized protein n=1 Tax=Paenibacillus shirakamiensis TaxID=1265935 RepID=A0ABS4JJN6_9BACL|nr:hypothetical protein [Paenibacillus shirakamiensis]MBP2000819.1 hypothetical protein [Paenibacillus shirakamiensis]
MLTNRNIVQGVGSKKNQSSKKFTRHGIEEIDKRKRSAWQRGSELMQIMIQREHKSHTQPSMSLELEQIQWQDHLRHSIR